MEVEEIKNIPPTHQLSSLNFFSEWPSTQLTVHNSLCKVQQRVHTSNIFCLSKTHKSCSLSSASVVIIKESTQLCRNSFCNYQQIPPGQLRSVKV